MKDPRIGKVGIASVTWNNGRVTETTGEILAIDEAAGEVYLDSASGAVVGDLSTLTIDDDVPLSDMES